MAKNRRKLLSEEPIMKRVTKLAAHRATHRSLLLGLVSFLVMVGLFCSSLLANRSYLELIPSELILPIVMYVISAVVITAIVMLLKPIRTITAQTVAAVTLSIQFADFSPKLSLVADTLRALMPGLTPNDPLAYVAVAYFGVTVLIALGMGVLANRMLRFFERYGVKMKDMQIGVGIVLFFVIAPPIFSFAAKLPAIIAQSRAIAPGFAVDKANVPSEKPDIYYIVLDRYTNATTLTEQFAYSNDDFTSFLRGKGFIVKDAAHSNYPYTAMSVASTLSADYIKKAVEPFVNDPVQSRSLYHNLTWQSPVARAFKDAGYHYYVIGTNYATSYQAPLADFGQRYESKLSVFGIEKKFRGVESEAFKSSPYYHLARIPLSWWPLQVAEHTPVTTVRDQLRLLHDIANDKNTGGRFIFAHILVPHDPFSFNADGSLASFTAPDSFGRPVKHKYIDQVTFINSYMKALVDDINRNSGNKAVILFNSDEGPYPNVLNDTFTEPAVLSTSLLASGSTNADMRRWPDDWLRMKYGILQAVHIPRATPEDLDQLTSINLFRIVLNRYAGIQLPYRSQCIFGLTDGSANEFRYADISERLEGISSSDCKSAATVGN